MIRRILLPVYGRQEDHPALGHAVWLAEQFDAGLLIAEDHPAFGHALWLAEQFDAELLIAAIVDQSKFMKTIAGPTEGMLSYMDRDALDAFTQNALREVDALVKQATARGRSAAAAPSPCSFPEGVTELTRQCDIVVESKLHRSPLLSRKLLDTCDLYEDASCPILVSRGEPFKTEPILLIYTTSPAANRALRWVTRLGEHIELHAHVLVMHDQEDKRERLREEVMGFTGAHGIRVEMSVAHPADGFRTAIDVAKGLTPAFLALPTYAFRRPLRLRVQGIDAKALGQFDCSVLLFA